MIVTADWSTVVTTGQHHPACEKPATAYEQPFYQWFLVHDGFPDMPMGCHPHRVAPHWHKARSERRDLLRK